MATFYGQADQNLGMNSLAVWNPSSEQIGCWFISYGEPTVEGKLHTAYAVVDDFGTLVEVPSVNS